MKKFALVIGRFQPPAKHHLEMLKEVFEISECQKLLIGIGDCGEINEKNFLKANEVKEILETILKQTKIKYEIKIIPDINNPPKYGKYVETFFPKINETNCQVYTENDYTKDCFVNFGLNYEVICPTIQLNKATEIRKMMKENNFRWKLLVPQKTAEYIIKKNLIQRLKTEKENVRIG